MKYVKEINGQKVEIEDNNENNELVYLREGFEKVETKKSK